MQVAPSWVLQVISANGPLFKHSILERSNSIPKPIARAQKRRVWPRRTTASSLQGEIYGRAVSCLQDVKAIELRLTHSSPSLIMPAKPEI
jgi:hypothetical protein